MQLLTGFFSDNPAEIKKLMQSIAQCLHTFLWRSPSYPSWSSFHLCVSRGSHQTLTGLLYQPKKFCIQSDVISMATGIWRALHNSLPKMDTLTLGPLKLFLVLYLEYTKVLAWDRNKYFWSLFQFIRGPESCQRLLYNSCIWKNKQVPIKVIDTHPEMINIACFSWVETWLLFSVLQEGKSIDLLQ